ncbi:MAG: hypothetical protein GFH25_541324n37 [Chloroflexi bacterium AL-N10]|nr:hypothetical protein [Chloroflexi bacterium AL-N10]
MKRDDGFLAKIEQAALKTHVPGVAIAISEFDQVSTYSVGVIEKEAREVTEQSIFHVSSLAKPVFAALIVLLHKNGIVNIDRPIIEWGGLEHRIDHPWLAQVTARSILNHSSGIVDTNTNSTLINVASAPSTAFTYSNSAYWLLQNVLIRSKLPELGSYLETFLKNLNMLNSTFLPDSLPTDNVTTGYDIQGNQVQRFKPYPLNIAHSLFSCPQDFVTFMSTLIQTDDLFEEIIDMANHVTITSNLSWSIGWGIQQVEGETALWHSGSSLGYTSYVVCYPERRISVAIMANRDRCFDFLFSALISSNVLKERDLHSLRWLLKDPVPTFV